MIENYLPLKNKYKEKLNNYLSKKKVKMESSLNYIDEFDIEKYEIILYHLQNMIKYHSKYVEKYWQDEISKIITLIMPQYIFKLKEVRISSKEKRRIDILLVNANGNVDIIEVKRYDSGSLIGKNSNSRGNYRPSSNLSSTIIQAEKYAYLCNIYSEEFNKEKKKKIQEKYKMEFKVNVINPKTIIIMGNSDDMNDEEKSDFELIRRMYSNVIDIITYGDLENRLRNLIQSLKSNMCKE